MINGNDDTPKRDGERTVKSASRGRATCPQTHMAPGARSPWPAGILPRGQPRFPHREKADHRIQEVLYFATTENVGMDAVPNHRGWPARQTSEEAGREDEEGTGGSRCGYSSWPQEIPAAPECRETLFKLSKGAESGRSPRSWPAPGPPTRPQLQEGAWNVPLTSKDLQLVDEAIHVR